MLSHARGPISEIKEGEEVQHPIWAHQTANPCSQAQVDRPDQMMQRITRTTIHAPTLSTENRQLPNRPS